MRFSRRLAPMLALPMLMAVAAKDAPSQPEWDMIAFEASSWGEPVSAWRIGKTGGSWTETVRKDGARIGDYTLAIHEIEGGGKNTREIARILKDIPIPAPDSGDCENFMTDMVYGTVRLTKGATTTEIAWNSGCMDENYRPLLDALKAADARMREWGKAGKVIRTEAGPAASLAE